MNNDNLETSETFDLDTELSDASFDALEVSNQTPVEDTVLNTVVADDDLVVAPVETSGTPAAPGAPAKEKTAGRGRGRVASAEVADRRAQSVAAATALLRASKEPLTVSQLVREVEKTGVTHKSVWSDVYTFLNNGNHEFVEVPHKGSRTKWGCRPTE